MKDKKLLKLAAGAVASVLVAFILLLANGLLGNPVSKALAMHTAKSHVAEHYPKLNLELSQANFDFKRNDYYVTVQSSTSVDTHFTLSMNSWGKLTYDNYEHRVLGLENTRERVDTLYREQVDGVIDVASFPYPGYIKYGEMHSTPNEALELDKEYDVMALAKDYGHLVVYIEDETITAQRAAEILLDMRQLLDEAGITFASIDFQLIKPRVNDLPNPDDTRFGVADFPYTDIYQENFVPRLTQAADALNDYYAQQDALKDGELAQVR